MPKKLPPLHPAIKETLGYEPSAADADVLTDWKKRLRTICKPCWELKYCPYGPLVEDFPLPPLTRESVESHNKYLQDCLDTGRLGDGSRLDKKRKKWFQEQISTFNPSHHPDSIPSIVQEAGCRVFGHICPAFFVSEPLTETKTTRKHSRSIPRGVMIKVIRRDGQICQHCNLPVRDDDVEFDHIIPFARGGTSTAENIRLLHRDCNRVKSDSLQELLAPDPLVHLYAMQQKRQKKRRPNRPRKRV